jgi:hypothetical protein
MDYRALLIAPLAAVVMSVGASDLRMPDGWFEHNMPTAPLGGKTYQIGVDPASEASGTPSLTVRSVARPDSSGLPSVGAVHQSTVGYAGKRVRFSAQVRTEGTPGWAGLYLGAGNGATLAGILAARPGAGKLLPAGSAVPADGQWHDASVVLDVPASQGSIEFGLALVGEGQTWARGLRFDVVGPEIAPTKATIGIDVAQRQRVLAQYRETMAKFAPVPLMNPALD